MARSSIDFDPFASDTLVDPYPGYAWLREHAPVTWCEPRRAWVVTGYDDVVGLLRDHALLAKRAQPARGTPRPGVPWPVRGLSSTDPPEYQEIRNLVPRAFTPRAVQELIGSVRGVADHLLDQLGGAETVDLAARFLTALPLRVIAQLFGLPSSDVDRVIVWAEQRRHGSVPPAFVDYMLDRVVERRVARGSDLISGLVGASDDAGGVLSDLELAAVCVHIVSAGHETTASLIGNTLNVLLGAPAERNRIRQGDVIMPAVIEETLRFDAPFQVQTRVAREDCEIRGQAVERDATLLLVIGSANRDPTHYGPDADRFDPLRDVREHLAFGAGPHFCLGAPLARLEADIAVSRLLERFPAVRFDPDRSPERNCTVQHRGFRSFPVRIGST